MIALSAKPKDNIRSYIRNRYDAVDDGFDRTFSSTGFLSKLSYHCTRLPNRNAHEPQKVASEDSNCAPLLP